MEMREGRYHSYTALGAPSQIENPRGSKIWAAGLESTLTCLEDPAVAFVESTGSRQADQLSSYCHFSSSRACALVGKRRTVGPWSGAGTWVQPDLDSWVLSQGSQEQLSDRLSQGVGRTFMQREYFSWRLLCGCPPSRPPTHTFFVVVQLPSHVQLFATPWTAARQASLSLIISQTLPKFVSIAMGMPSNQVILCCPLLLLPSIFPSVRVFFNESALLIKWPRYCSLSFGISPSNEYSGLISFRIDWFDLLAVQGTLKSCLQYHSSKASIIWRSAFLMVQLSHLKRP